ncbi:Receptor-type guanylate cyclase gcy [Seminavis robusta]|uniref:Receptor-type guanylate cyclase gcy n=1 Tax=Seminavis robusta TaxID=568900 RepID=A0A9N8DK03_9STRA|nr:Receptor-type guanylate cyclase gcy [Seminavis robusta]|eukprot:Sro170_g075300.1 Receptor-type guanylate cyclase gcy (851) ;mRNA; r:3293-6315
MMESAPDSTKETHSPAAHRVNFADMDFSETVDVDDMPNVVTAAVKRDDALAPHLDLMEEAAPNGERIETVPDDEDSDNDDSESHGGTESRMSSVRLESQQKRLRKETAKNLASKENKAVWMLRILVMGLLLAVTVVVLAGVYIFASQSEEHDFEDGFNIHASQLTESFRNAVERKLVAIGTMGNGMTSYAQATGAEFPFVTIPDFAVRASDIRVLADALIMVWCPFVTDQNRLKWEEYAFMNRFQVNKDFAQDNTYRQEQDDYFDSLVYGPNSTMAGHDGDNRRNRGLQEQEEEEDPNMLKDGTGYHLRIWHPMTDEVEPNGTGPFLPGFQRSPVNFRVQNAINTNYANARVFQGIDIAGSLLDSHQVIINRAQMIQPKFYKAMTANLQISQYREKIDTYLQDPLSFLAYPVFDSFNTTTRKLAGALISNLYWRVYFQNVLPPNAHGIIAVLSNSYNQTFSYHIDGGNATYLGDKDLHDPRYNEMEVSVDVSSYVRERSSPETRAYRTVPLHDTMGRYTLRVYPTDSTKEAYTTNKPAVYTAVVACIFAVTALVFVLFDTWVEKRQRVVMKRAVESGAIVNELFPEEIQHRMYEGDQDTNNKMPRSSWKVNTEQEHGLQAVTVGEDKTNLVPSGGQIADEYKNCTVIFSDLAGFTAWSSSRSPSEVFELLETIYKAIDNIALRRKVFKVETIGDCWLGVCGLPHPNPKHALVMARFADDCQKKMQELVVSLSRHLGADTETLKLRIGMHSGSVTAGVLRGQKSRFQLFGDTVNTASRMESNGQPGRIHASKTTADELIASGKRSWLKAREDKVVAKGKGELQTYWIELGLDTKSCHTTVSSLDTPTRDSS